MNLPSHRQDPREPGFVQNPYPFYKQSRVSDYFYWDDYSLICSGKFAIVDAILRDRRFGRELPADIAPPSPAHLVPFYEFESRTMLEREPPVHTRLRGLMVRAFTNRRIAELEPEITALSQELVDGCSRNEIDLLPTYAEKIPVIIICRFLGVPEDMADQLLAWSHDMVAMYQARRDRTIEDSAVKATQEFSDFIRGYIEKRKKSPKDDLITHLIAAEADGDKLDMEELIATCILLLNAGHEATVHGIGNGIATLLSQNPKHLEGLKDAKQCGRIVDEIMRFDPPLHMFTRYALEDVEAHGYRFSRGEKVGLLLAGANRDPEKYANPEVFDPVRGGTGNVAFGAGLHFCIGAPLAKLEMSIALNTLFVKFPKLRLAEEPVYADRYHFHGLNSLKVHLE